MRVYVQPMSHECASQVRHSGLPSLESCLAIEPRSEPESLRPRAATGDSGSDCRRRAAPRACQKWRHCVLLCFQRAKELLMFFLALFSDFVQASGKEMQREPEVKITRWFPRATLPAALPAVSPSLIKSTSSSRGVYLASTLDFHQSGSAIHLLD